MTNNNLSVCAPKNWTFDVPTRNLQEPKLPSSQHLDEAAFKKWVTAHPKKYQTDLESLKGKIRHITFKEFNSGLAKAAQNLKKVIGDQRFYGLVEPGKSNQWVAELAHFKHDLKASKYIRLGEENAQVFKAIVKEKLKTPKGKKQAKGVSYNIVLYDDGSFSGTQMYNHVSKISHLFSKHDLKYFIHVLVPYITNHARKKISQINTNSISLYSAGNIPTLAESFPKESALDSVTEVLCRGEQNKEGRLMRAREIGMVWWDHKVPNSKSFPDSLARGLVKDSSEKIPFIPDIKEPYKEFSEK